MHRRRVGYGASITGLAWGESVTLGNVRVSLHPAGHILGSAILTLRLATEGGERVITFSGDLGRGANPMLRDPMGSWRAIATSMRPFTTMTLAFNFTLGQLQPFGYHAAEVAGAPEDYVRDLRTRPCSSVGP